MRVSTVLRVVGVLAAALVVPAAPVASAAPDACAPWSARVVASSYGPLENLAFDGRGNVLLSESTGSIPGSGNVQRLGADGTRSIAVSGVDGPGGIVAAGNTAYFTTGNSPRSAITGAADGTIAALDLDTGAVRTVATGLPMPNGLALLPGGNFVVSRDVGPGTLTLVESDGDHATPFPPSLTSTNGLAFDPPRNRLVVSTTFNPSTVVAAIDVTDPGRATETVLPGWGVLNSADDLTVGPDGTAYVALNSAGAIARVDLDAHTSCRIAEGIPFASSVRFGSGPGWNPDALYVTSFLGTVTELTPR